MPHPIMYAKDHYVILCPGQEEEFVTAAEMLERLRAIVTEHPDLLPRQSPQLPPQDEMLQDLLDNSCELSWDNGNWIQWYAVRLES
ncbi:MAG: chlororespiratory reduction protein 7 [Prochlorotrichaceae cyanobacterium]